MENSTLIERNQFIWKCPKCLLDTRQIKNHLKIECAQASLISELQKNSLKYQDSSVICLKCFRLFNSGQWQYHRKARSRKSVCSFDSSSFRSTSFVIDETAKKKIGNEHSGDQQQTAFKQLVTVPLTTSMLHSQLLPEYFSQYMRSSIGVFLITWIRQNIEIGPQVLFRVFQGYCQRFSGELASTFKKPTYGQMIAVDKKVKWLELFPRIQLLFNRSYVTDILKREDIIPLIKNRIIRAINRMYSAYGTVFRPFKKIKEEKHVIERQKYPFLPFEFISMIYELFRSKKKSLVHIGLDLCIMYQSCCRFPSDLDQIQEKLLIYLSDQKRGMQFHIISKKTGKQQTVILNIQLIQLLLKFKWTGFFKRKIYQRAHFYLQFPIYSLRRGFFSFIFWARNDHKIGLFTGHSNERNASYYYKTLKNEIIGATKKLIQIPNILFSSKSLQQTKTYFQPLEEMTQKIILPSGWIYRTISKLQQFKLDCSICNFLCIDEEFKDLQINQVEENGPIDNQSNNQKNLQPQKPIIESKIHQIMINSLPFEMVDNTISIKQLFIEKKKITCKHCSVKEDFGKICILCSSQLCFKCINKWCYCCQSPKRQRFQWEGYRKSLLTLNMPEQYLKPNHQVMDQFMLILFARSYYFTSVAVCHESLSQFNNSQLSRLKLERVELDKHTNYEEGTYMAPIYPQLSGNNSVHGAGFGIFASQDIQKMTFICEYGAQIMLGKQSMAIQRRDCIMRLVNGADFSSQIILAPQKYCGIGVLFNTCKNPNCLTKLCTVNGGLSVIIYTNKRIRKGEQLTIDYRRGSRAIKQEKVSKIDIQKSDLTIEHRPRNSCFIFSALHIIRCLVKHSILCLSKIPGLKYTFYQDLWMWLYGNQPLSMNRIYQKLQKEDIKHFQIGFQDDVEAFLLWLIQKLEKSNIIIKERLYFRINQSVKCTQCQNISSHQQLVLVWRLFVDTNLEKWNQKDEEQIKDYDCQVCQARTLGIKQIEIISYPNAILFHLSRWNYNSQFKDSTQKHFPDRLTVRERQYRRVLSAHHYGTNINNGHYNVCDHQLGLMFDDEDVNDLEDIDYSSIIMIVYMLDQM